MNLIALTLAVLFASTSLALAMFAWQAMNAAAPEPRAVAGFGGQPFGR